MGRSVPRSISAALACLALVPASAASAATQGSLGAASRGSLTITLTIRAPTRVSGVSDVSLDGAVTAGRAVCLSGMPHSYTVAASGTGPGGALTLSNGTASVPYRVEWLAGSGAETVAAPAAPVTLRAVADPAECARAGCRPVPDCLRFGRFGEPAGRRALPRRAAAHSRARIAGAPRRRRLR